MKHYHPHETAHMQELQGIELASFKSRACALFIDVVICVISFIFIVGGSEWLMATL